MMHAGHVVGAWILGWGTLLHVLAVIKHMAVDRDGAFDRMMVPAVEQEAEEGPTRKGGSGMAHASPPPARRGG